MTVRDGEGFLASRRIPAPGVTGIAERMEGVRERITRAAARAGRSGSAVTLVGVTKTVDVARIREAVSAGLGDLGENRVQEAMPKVAAMGAGPRWHLIGHLQRNKTRQAVEAFAMFHALDSIRLAEALDRAARRAGRRIPVLLEVNVAGEPSMHGVAPDEAAALLDATLACASLEPLGLMTIAPLAERPETVRPVFRRLRELRDRLQPRGGARFTELSMGMTQDFEIAVEEGATMIRVGRAIFGER